MNTSVFGDVRLAARLLAKDKWFTLAAVAALALGIAANNTAFTLVNGVLLRDLPFADPDRIVSVGIRNSSNPNNGLGALSYPELRDWQAGARTFDGLAGFSEQTMNVADEGHAPERFGGAFISPHAFTLIGVRPLIGRDFHPDDDREGATPVVILGHDVWRNRYGSDPDVIGRAVRINGVPSVVIGVMPEGVLFPQRSFLWRPLMALDQAAKTDRRDRGVRAFGRLSSGTSHEQAVADLEAVSSLLARQYPATNRDAKAGIVPFRSGIGGPVRALLASMMGAVAFVLLIACANVANLLLSRASRRAREVSIRMSMGASRWRVIRQLLLESLLLSTIAGAVGLALSIAAIRLFWRSAAETDPPYWLQFPMDWRVFSFLALVCVGTSIVFGLVPALYTSKTNLTDVLNDAGRGSVGNRRSRRWSGVLVAGQLALALVLLSGAGLMVRNLLTLSMMDAGIDTANLVRLRLDLPSPAYDAPDTRLALFRQLEDRMAATPGLRATLANAVPLVGGASRTIAVAGRPDTTTPAGAPRATVLTVGRNYFDVLGVRMSHGRLFVDGEGAAGRGVAIVNERFAATHFPDGDAVGHRIRFDGSENEGSAQEWMTIVGVVQNVRQRPPADGGFDPVIYIPFAANVVWGVNALVRSPSEPALAASILRGQLAAIDPDLPFYDVRRVDDFVYSQRWAERVFGSMFGIFGVIALVLATVGLYAVTAYSVAQRTREIGVRVAVGAQARHVWWLVMRAASSQIAIGLALGIAGSVFVARVVPTVITRAEGTQTMTLAMTVTLLLAVAVTACLIPSRRAMRMDPVAALRSE